MPRQRTSTSPTGLLNSAHAIDSDSDFISDERRIRQIRRALVITTFVGPPVFPIKRSTGNALFDLALYELARNDKNAAEALRLYAGVHARMERLDLDVTISGETAVGATLAEQISETCKALNFILEEPTLCPSDDIPKYFIEFRRGVGKRKCFPLTLRWQDEQLRRYARDHHYPQGTRASREQRATWAREHLPKMIANAKQITCWHPQLDLTNEERDKVLRGIDKNTSPSNLSALLLSRLHSTTTGYVLKHLLARRKSTK